MKVWPQQVKFTFASSKVQKQISQKCFGMNKGFLKWVLFPWDEYLILKINISQGSKTNHCYNMTGKENMVLWYEEHTKLFWKKSYQLKED